MLSLMKGGALCGRVGIYEVARGFFINGLKWVESYCAVTDVIATAAIGAYSLYLSLKYDL